MWNIFLIRGNVNNNSFDVIDDKNIIYNLLPTGPGSRSNKVPAETVLQVVKFINCLPTTTSHHSRRHYPNRRFVPPGMTNRTIYCSYVDWVDREYPEDVFNCVTFSKFKDILNKGFNITRRLVIFNIYILFCKYKKMILLVILHYLLFYMMMLTKCLCYILVLIFFILFLQTSQDRCL